MPVRLSCLPHPLPLPLLSTVPAQFQHQGLSLSSQFARPFVSVCLSACLVHPSVCLSQSPSPSQSQSRPQSPPTSAISIPSHLRFSLVYNKSAAPDSTHRSLLCPPVRHFVGCLEYFHVHFTSKTEMTVPQRAPNIFAVASAPHKTLLPYPTPSPLLSGR